MSQTIRNSSAKVSGALACVLAIVCASAWIRVPGFVRGGFASYDVGGILYNAMLIRTGQLPYVASVELKPPGSFYLAAILAGPEGRDIASLQIAANAWALCSLSALAFVAWRAFGPWAAVLASGLYALHDAHFDTMDANYVTWAQLPLTLALACGIEAVRAKRSCSRYGWLFGAGACVGLATLAKQPSALAFLPLALVGIRAKASVRDVLCQAGLVFAGGLTAQLPVMFHYAAAGQLSTLLSSYPIGEWNVRYVERHVEGPVTTLLFEGVLASVHFLALPLALAGFAVAAPKRGCSRELLPLLAGWSAVMWISASLGLRFYKGYFVPLLSPLCVLAVAPWGVLGRQHDVRTTLHALALVPMLMLGVRQGNQLANARARRSAPSDLASRRIADHIARQTSAHDRIWVWGWHLWGVYAQSGRLSGTRVYKALGILTPPNDDTWRRPASPQTFVSGPWGQQVVEELVASETAYIVLGSTVPHHDFTGLRELLARDYVKDESIRVGKVELWRRTGRAR